MGIGELGFLVIIRHQDVMSREGMMRVGKGVRNISHYLHKTGFMPEEVQKIGKEGRVIQKVQGFFFNIVQVKGAGMF